MRRLLVLGLVPLLFTLGCPANDDDSSVGDDDDSSGVDDDDAAEQLWLFDSDEDVGLGIVGGQATPLVAYQMWNSQVTNATGDCPEVTEAAGTLTVTGGCADGGGRQWEGTITAAMDLSTDPQTRSMVYDGFSITSPAGDVVVALDGTQEVEGTDLNDPAVRRYSRFDTAAELHVGAMAAFTDVRVYSEIVHTGEVTSLPPLNPDRSISGAASIQGTVINRDHGTFDVDTVDLLHDPACDREGMSGVVVLIGANTVTATHEGEIECDGCFGYVSDDGLDSVICPH